MAAAGTVQAYELKGAGLKEVNGIYVRDGDHRGSPRYRQMNSSKPFYIRQGGSVNIGFGIIEESGAKGAPGAWAYFCENSRNKKGLQLVPEDGWVSHGRSMFGLKAVEPGPTVTPYQAEMQRLKEAEEKRIPAEKKDAYEVKGAGLKEVNGIYVRDGNFRGSPRYKQINSSTPEDPFYIRQGGNLHSGYGISRGAEKYAGHWAYFCEKSRGKKSIQFVPEDSWVSQGGLNAVEPSPTVVRAKDPDAKAWVRVFYHNLDPIKKEKTAWATKSNFRSINCDDPTASLYSCLDSLENYRQKNGELVFRMSWPGSKFEPQVWAQTSNPTKAETVEGYRSINSPHTQNHWSGLKLTNSRNCNWGDWSCIDGCSSRGFWYAIALTRAYDNGYPGPTNPAVRCVELEIQADKKAEEQRLKEEEEKRLQAEKEDRLKELTEENKELKKSVEEYKKLKQLYDMNRERLKKANCLAIFIGNSNYKKLFTRVSIVEREMKKIKSIFGNATNWTFEQHIDVTLDQWNSLMHVELPKLRKKLKPKVILFYYLGHGVQIDNEDFFVSQDEKLIKVDWIKNNPDVQESNAIVICNCCRENLTDEQEQTLVDASDEFEDLGFHMKELRKGALHACFVVDKRLKEYYKPGKATRFASTFEEIMQKRLKQEDAFDLVHVLMETNTSLQSLKCTYKECDKLEPGEYRIHGGIVAPFFTNQS